MWNTEHRDFPPLSFGLNIVGTDLFYKPLALMLFSAPLKHLLLFLKQLPGKFKYRVCTGCTSVGERQIEAVQENLVFRISGSW